MRRKNAELLDDVLSRFLRQEGLETPLNEYRLIHAWPKVVGPLVVRYTENLRIYNQILYVRLKSPSLRENLMMERKSLVTKLNATVGSLVIIDIVLH